MKQFPLVVLLSLCVALALGLLAHKQDAASRMLGQTPDSFTLPLLEKPKRQASLSDWLGKVVLLNVFASWCPSCALEHPLLMKLPSSAQPVGIAWRDQPQKISDWLKTHGNPYRTVLMDPQGSVTTKLGLTGVPETFVIAKDGRIAYSRKEPLTEEEISTVVLPLIERLEDE